MKKIIHYNFIIPIIQKMKSVLDIYTDKKIIWFGRENYVPIMNTCLLKSNKYISLVIDNDKSKWGNKVSNYYPVNTGRCNNENKNIPEIFIKSPESIKDKTKEVIVFLASKYENQMVNQLKELGVNNEFIYTFPTEEEDCILKNKDIQKELINWKKLSLKELQQRELQILKYFKNFCDNNRLNYFLAGGTLLGAVRHKGFIPWDDDIDVYMPYDDYKRFLEIYKDNEKYYLCDWSKNDNYVLQFAKLIDCNTLLFHGGFPIQMQLGVFIDIFPLTGFPNEKEKLEKKWKENVSLNDEWLQYYIANDILKNIRDTRKEIFEKKCTEYPINNSNKIGAMHTFHIKDVWAIKHEYFADYTQVLFEDEYFKAPIGYKEYLTCRYGNYMQIPDEKNRLAHLFPAYINKQKFN